MPAEPPAISFPPRLLDRVRIAARQRHYSLRTEQSYVAWVRRFILFHGKRHPKDMGAPEIVAFLSDLAVRRRVSASTQNQALSSLLFLYRHTSSTASSRASTRPSARASAARYPWS